jgi:AraC-like DNA-binding protein
MTSGDPHKADFEQEPSMPSRDPTIDQILELVAEELGTFRASIPPAPPHVPADISRLLRHIQNRLFDRGLSVASARLACDLRNHNVSGRFRRIVGTAPRQYIEGLRMEAARRLLKLGSVPVYLGAAAVGYEHAEVFNRAFRRSTGMTPSQFRMGCDGKELGQDGALRIAPPEEPTGR